jgi:putative transposase
VKAIRMDKEAYEQGGAFSNTIATARREPFFRDAELVASCLNDLRLAAEKYSASVYAYCFMPDHLHLLVDVPVGTNLVVFVRHLKQLTTYRLRHMPRHHGKSLWQRRFYDHALRREEQVGEVADYTWGNPVRAGLVNDASLYPHSGSLAWELDRASRSEDPNVQRTSRRPSRIDGLSGSEDLDPRAFGSRGPARTRLLARRRGSSDPRAHAPSNPLSGSKDPDLQATSPAPFSPAQTAGRLGCSDPRASAVAASRRKEHAPWT